MDQLVHSPRHLRTSTLGAGVDDAILCVD
jgi:hypothetical protein